MTIDVSPIPVEDKPVLRQMFELYRYDFSAFDGRDLSDHGWYDYGYLDNYWTEANRYPFMIRVDGKLAGFVLISQWEDTFSISEFFVLRKYRRQGIGETVAREVISQFPGRWKLSVNTANTAGVAFWRTTIARITGDESTEHPADRPGWIIHQFTIPTEETAE